MYHRIDYLRVFYSAGILRVDWVNSQDTRIIFPPVVLRLKTPRHGCTHSLMVKQIDDGSSPSVCSRLKSSGSYQMPLV